MSNGDGDLSYSLNATLGRREFLVTEQQTQTGSNAAGQQNLLRFGGFRVRGHIDTLSMTPGLNLAFDNGDTVSLQGFLDANRFSRYGDIAAVTLSPQPDGSVRLIIQGLKRFRIVEWVAEEPYLQARPEPARERREEARP